MFTSTSPPCSTTRGLIVRRPLGSHGMAPSGIGVAVGTEVLVGRGPCAAAGIGADPRPATPRSATNTATPSRAAKRRLACDMELPRQGIRAKDAVQVPAPGARGKDWRILAIVEFRIHHATEVGKKPPRGGARSSWGARLAVGSQAYAL